MSDAAALSPAAPEAPATAPHNKGPTAAPAAPAAASSDNVLISRLTSQVKKLTESNAKYKNLLKLAKERIQQQEEELGELTTALESATSQINTTVSSAAGAGASSGSDEHPSASNEDATSAFIVRVCQRVKVSSGGGSSSSNNNNNGREEIWALMELEQSNPLAELDPMSDVSVRRYKEWQRFDTEQQLQDAIRRDTGEPLQLPPFSLTPEQSSKIQKQAKLEMAALQEEFRRFRVKAELSRKQAEVHIRDLQSSSKQSAAQRIEGSSSENNNNINNATRNAGTEHTQKGNSKNGTANQSATSNGPGNGRWESQVEQLRAELVAQEAYWKEAYDTLLAENNALKSSGSEALLASQWRQRYEHSRQELAELQRTLAQTKADDSQIMYESKYRDLKESFRLYRKKAKEIFENTTTQADTSFLSSIQDGSADAKLSYLRNLLVNYFTAEDSVRPHMEGAIGTLLQFSQEDVERIEKKRAEEESWLF